MCNDLPEEGVATSCTVATHHHYLYVLPLYQTHQTLVSMFSVIRKLKFNRGTEGHKTGTVYTKNAI